MTDYKKMRDKLAEDIEGCRVSTCPQCAFDLVPGMFSPTEVAGFFLNLKVGNLAIAIVRTEGELPRNPHGGKFDKVNISYPKGIPKGYHILRDAGNEEGYDEAQQAMSDAGYTHQVIYIGGQDA